MIAFIARLALIVLILVSLESSPGGKSKVAKISSQKSSDKNQKKTNSSQKVVYKYFIPNLNLKGVYPINLSFKEIKLPSIPTSYSYSDGFYFLLDSFGNKIVLTVNPQIQKIVESEVRNSKAHTVALVVLDVNSGRILGYSGASLSIPNPVLHDGFKIASIFKIITAAAAIDFANVDPYTILSFRGGTYELSRSNFLPDFNSDRRVMTLEEGLAKSANPVFARLALKYLDDRLLSFYTDRFGFNISFPSDFELPRSRGYIPTDQFELARVAAGFGSIFLTPIHAASIIAAIGNKGYMMAPKIVEYIISRDGSVIYAFRPSVVSKVVTEASAQVLLRSMISTHTVGTAAKSFKDTALQFQVSGKTGTLSIDNPRGLMRSYVATFPTESPKYGLSVFVVNPKDELSKPTSIARRVIERILYENSKNF